MLIKPVLGRTREPRLGIIQKEQSVKQMSSYCGHLGGFHRQTLGPLTSQYSWPVFFFTDAVVLTRPAGASRVAWNVSQAANTVTGATGLGLPTRPLLRHDFDKIVAIVDDLTSNEKADLTSGKAVVALHKYAHVVPNSKVWHLEIARLRTTWVGRLSGLEDVNYTRLRLYYLVRKVEFVTPKSPKDVMDILRKAFGSRFDALRRL